MPANFQVSSPPALRCLSGETYPLHASAAAAGFFSRLRMAERLVIQSGPPQSGGPEAREWRGSCAQLERREEYRRNISHA